MKLTQKGFAVVETFLVILILAIIGGTGYYVYQSHNKATDTLNQANLETNSPATFKKKATKDINYDYGNCFNQTFAKHPTASLDRETGSCSTCLNPHDDGVGVCDKVVKTYAVPKEFSPALIAGYSTLPSSAQDEVIAIAKETFPYIPESQCFGGGAVHGFVWVEKVVEPYILLYVAHNCGDPGTTILKNDKGDWKPLPISGHYISDQDIQRYKIPKDLLN